MHTDGVQPTQKEETVHHNIIETIGYKGLELAPQVDWNNLPRIMDASRVAAYKAYLVRNKMPEKEVTHLLSEIRYISPEVTTETISILGKHLEAKVGAKPYVMVHCEDGHSGAWICNQLASKHGFDKGVVSYLNINKLIELLKTKAIPFGTQILIPDDLGIFYEQIAQHIVKPIIKQCGEEWFENIHIGLLAGTDHVKNGFTSDAIVRAGSFSRVFRVPTLGEMGFHQIPNNINDSYMLTCFDHKVPDRFLSVLTRSCRQKDEFGKPQWIVDDILLSPPYEPLRFSSGGSRGPFAASVREETQ